MFAGYESGWLLDNRALTISTISEVAREKRISLRTGLEKGLAATSTKGVKTPKQSVHQSKSGSLKQHIMDESQGLDHDCPHPDNDHVGFHPQVNIQQDPEQSFRSENDFAPFTAPMSTHDPLGSFVMPVELGYGKIFQARQMQTWS